MSLLSEIENAFASTINRFVPIPLPPGVPGAGDVVKAEVNAAPAAVKDASTVISDAGSAISSVGDFLSYIAWIFHPLNILRAVEFIAGFNLLIVGTYILTRSRARGGATSSPIVRRAIQASPAGKVIRVRQGTRMGRYEGQREAARMTARQAETRSARESSAVERETINVNARKTARSQ